MALPPSSFLADVYRHLPFVVIHATTDGIVLHCNPEALRVTGYAENELVGMNLWATLFPGKLFAQVPRFISLIEPSPLLKDVPMTIRTKSGTERVIAFSRYLHGDAGGGAAGGPGPGPRTFICVGVDLTDRLLDADRAQLPAEGGPGGPGLMAFGPHVGNAGAIDGEIIAPIAISPRRPGTTGPCPIEQVREGLARVETHIYCVHGAFDEGERHMLGAMAGVLAAPQTRAGQLAFEMLSRGDDLHLRACDCSLGTIRARVDELLALYRPELP